MMSNNLYQKICCATVAVLLPAFFGACSNSSAPMAAATPGGASIQTVSADGLTTTVITAEGGFAPTNPITDPPGSNFIATVNSNAFDGNGVEMPNTNPSTPAVPYNLHDGPVVITDIDDPSPTQDLREIFATLKNSRGGLDLGAVQRAIDILEGNPIADRTWSGMPLLHYTGPEKVKSVVPILDGNGNTIGGNVDVHQVWYDSHIESDTAFLDSSAVQGVPWTVTYTVDVLDRARDDFSPFVMYFDDPALSPEGSPPMPNVAMDQTFFPMDPGTRNIFKIKMSLGKYFNLIYTWGWRVHPPRVQVMENAGKIIDGMTLPEHEIAVFGPEPRADEDTKLAAIAMIGDMAPAKRMWNEFRLLLGATPAEQPAIIANAEEAFFDWFDRTKLPTGIEPNPDTNLTLLYANNTIYGEFADGRRMQRWWEWTTRPATFTVSLHNADHFVHGYVNVDFGGSRGWENQFHSTIPILGSGCWFTFGRVKWWINAGGPWGAIVVPPVAEDGTPGYHRVDLTLNFEPSRRLRFYQFDPLHHDVAIFSVH